MLLALMLRYETWMILGIVLIVLDVALGLDFFALSFGVGGLITSVGILIFGQTAIFQSWEATVISFGISSVLVLFPLRRWVLKSTRGSEDINHY